MKVWHVIVVVTVGTVHTPAPTLVYGLGVRVLVAGGHCDGDDHPSGQVWLQGLHLVGLLVLAGQVLGLVL